MEALPLRPGDAGEAVRDIQTRLAAVGMATPVSEHGSYGPATSNAVRDFQRVRGLTTDGICGRQTWSALVEAGYQLGDRLLYHRSPMLRGDDVSDLQRQLSTLGFDAGRVDGIFGPDTESALVDFQRNTGTTTDGVCGRDTVATLIRLGDRTAGAAGLARVRQLEALRGAPRSLDGRRIVIGEGGGLAGLLAALEHVLTDRGAVVAALHHPDQSAQATAANDFDAVAYLGLELTDEAGCESAYFEVPGFESIGGRRLAELIDSAVPAALGVDRSCVAGMRLPVLRETRMPAVSCRLGPPALLVAHAAGVADALGDALEAWTAQPY